MAGLVYSNFDVIVDARDDGAYDVEVRYPGLDPDVEHRAWCILPPKDAAGVMAPDKILPTNEIRKISPGGKPDANAIDDPMDKLTLYGERLFSTVLPKPLETLLALRSSMAEHDGEGLRVRIHIARASELAVIPWEALFRRASDAWLAIDEQTTLVRIIDDPDRTAPEPIAGRVRLLIAIAVPQSDLDSRTELAQIRESVARAAREKRTRVDIEVVPAATRRSLEQALERFRPHIVHFIGHGGFDEAESGGRRKGHIFLVSENDPGGYDRMPSDALRDLLDIEKPILVVLNSCQGGAADAVDRYGGAAQNLIRRKIPYVVAMQYPITDGAALAFSEYFYTRLFEGYAVDAAVARGRAAIRNRPDESTQVELITPVLYTAVGDPGPVVAQTPPRPRWLWMAAGALALALLAGGVLTFFMSGGRENGSNASVEMAAGAAPEPVEVATRNETATLQAGRESARASATFTTEAARAPVTYRIPRRTASPRPGRAPAAIGGDDAIGQGVGYATGSAASAAAGEDGPVGQGVGQTTGTTGSAATGSSTIVLTGATGSAPEAATPPSPGREPWAAPEPSPPPPPPPPPPAPPPPPPPVIAMDALVFFDFNSIAIAKDAVPTIDAVRAHLAVAGSGTRIRVIGHTDTKGSRSVNLAVSRMRARAVARALIRGIEPAPTIVTEGVGESQPRVQTADGVREVQNRRVEIILEPAD